LQLRLSERSGRGVPKIVEAYGRDAIKIEKNFIVVTIPFNRINVTPFELNEGQPTINPTVKATTNATTNATINATIKLTDSQKKILEKILSNPIITQIEIAEQLNLHRVSVTRSITKLQKLGVLKRVGSNKTGYWEIIENVL
jgi:predicted HTH transcriptional regulator